MRDIAAARRALRRPVLTDAGIHAVRRHLKRARAGLRLLRVLLGRTAYRRGNLALRDVAGSLRQARDAKVMREHARHLTGSARTRAALRSLRGELQRDHQRALARLRRPTREAAADLLQAVAQGLDRRFDAAPREEINAARTGLRRTYERSRGAFNAARRDASVESWHECRKQLKYLSHQLDLLADAGWVGMEAWRQRAHRLTALLGEDHDLALLRRRVMASGGGDALEDIAKALEQRCRKLRRKGLRLGVALLRRGSREFAGRAL